MSWVQTSALAVDAAKRLLSDDSQVMFGDAVASLASEYLALAGAAKSEEPES